MDTLVFAYYCSGHGYGHATRVSAFARHLLSLGLGRQLVVHIVSSAPRHVFADSIACGALYRYANIDPVIVQPLAYRVDRQKSVDGLEAFLQEKPALLSAECSWLIESGVTCVLSDAAFLGCLAAKSAGIPSILITNFTFDSVYSYLATSLVDAPAPASITPSSSQGDPDALPDIPIPYSTLAPLVAQIHDGYQHADLLLRLPGHIPVPSFFTRPPLPSPEWVDPTLNKFSDTVAHHLRSPPDTTPLHLPRPYPNSSCTIPRTVRAAPLLVRPPSPGIYTPQGRSEFLEKTGLPDFAGMKILVVSFGGQVFKRPGGSSRTTSRMQSRNPSQEVLPLPGQGVYAGSRPNDYQRTALSPLDTNTVKRQAPQLDLKALDGTLRTHIHIRSKPPSVAEYTPSHHRSQSARQPNRYSHHDGNISDCTSSDEGTPSPHGSDLESTDSHLPSLYNNISTHKRRHTLPSGNPNLGAYTKLATPSHLLIPGAPPVSKPPSALSRTLSPSDATHSGGGDTRLPLPLSETLEMRVIPPTPVVTHHSSTNNDSVYHHQSSLDAHTSDHQTHDDDDDDDNNDDGEEDGPGLLPDENWIAVICGVSKEQWNAENEEGGLPEGFYVAPRDVYMPDLVAIGDVVLGKLGYGMTSECVDACTPFVYVSRPLFIEEHGLRMYLDQEGTGIELSRTAYEDGEWARAVEQAYHQGLAKKEEKRRKEFEFVLKLRRMDTQGVKMADEARLSEREREGREMARGVIEWVRGVWDVLNRGEASSNRASEVGFPENAITKFNVDAKKVVVA